MAVITAPPTGSAARAAGSASTKLRLPTACHSMNIATRNPTSPIRLTMNAFLPASALAFSVNQNPMSR